jgi:RNA-directed DNA polymerase
VVCLVRPNVVRLSGFCIKLLFNDILGILTSDGFKLSFRKTKYKGNQTITGIEVFKNKIDAHGIIKEKSKFQIETNTKMKPYTNYLNNIRKTYTKKKKTITQNPIAKSNSNNV